MSKKQLKNTKANKSISPIMQKPNKWALIFIIIWAAVFNILYILAEHIFPVGFTLLLGFMLFYPVFTFCLFFMYAKRNGITLLMPFGVIPILVTEYIFITPVRSIIPNVLLATGLCMLFGSGMGNIFADTELIQSLKKQRQDKKLNEDKKYKKILDD